MGIRHINERDAWVTNADGDIIGIQLHGRSEMVDLRNPVNADVNELTGGNRFFDLLKAPKIVLFGDSRTADCGYSDATTNVVTNLSWFDWGQYHAGAAYVDVVANAGIGGNTTSQMLARVQSDVLAHNPDYCTLWGGTNDGLASTAAADAAFANMVSIMEQLRRRGVHVFLISETTGAPPLRTTPFPAVVQYYNDKLRAYAASNKGVDYWDFNSILTDPTNANGYSKSGWTRDGLHLGALSASTIGKLVVAPALQKIGRQNLAVLPCSQVDSLGNNTYVTQALSNVMCINSTGGSNGSGHSGTLPSGWTSSGSHTVVHSVVARPDGFGNNIQAAITAAAAGSYYLNSGIGAGRVVPGGKYVIEGSFEIDGPVALYRFGVALQVYVGATLYKYGIGQQVQVPTGSDGMIAVSNGVFRSRVVTVPDSITPTSQELSVSCGFSGAGSATMRIGRLGVRRVG